MSQDILPPWKNNFNVGRLNCLSLKDHINKENNNYIYNNVFAQVSRNNCAQ